MNNLNKCPFCGGYAELVIRQYPAHGVIYGSCTVCGAAGKQFEYDVDDNEKETAENRAVTKMKAEKAWNMRYKDGGNNR